MATSAVKRARPGRSRRVAASTRARVLEMQRARILGAAAAIADEEGYAHMTVTSVTGRAHVSRRTFYQLFEDREACLCDLFDDAIARAEAEIARACAAERSWSARVRAGLVAILAFLDREPALARVCVVQSLHSGPRILARREQVLTRLASALAERDLRSAHTDGTSELTAEGLVGAIAAIVYARLLRREPRPLTSLTGELMSMIVLPYLGPAAARRERARPAPAHPPASASVPPSAATDTVPPSGDPLKDVRMRMTYRTALVLEGIARDPGASNRAIGEHAGVLDQGQISKLLARLERLGLIENGGSGQTKGERNAWRLTATGAHIERSVRPHTLTREQDGAR